MPLSREQQKPRGVRDACERQRMLSDLSASFTYPYLLDQCGKKSNAKSLRGLGKWLRFERKCKVCKRHLPASREKCCGGGCLKKWRAWRRYGKQAALRRKGVPLWIDFSRSVQAPIPIAVLAEKKGIDLDEARRVAEGMHAKGLVRVWRGQRGGEIREIGVPVEQVAA